MGIDEDAIAFRKWQPVVESRLASLESGGTHSTITANVGLSPEFQKQLDDLKATIAAIPTGSDPEIATLKAKVTELEAAVASMNATLANVEAALAPLHAAAGSTPGG